MNSISLHWNNPTPPKAAEETPECQNAEKSLSQFQSKRRQHFMEYFTVDVNMNSAFIIRNWAIGGEQMKISPHDKELLRLEFLDLAKHFPLLLRTQIGECLKTVKLVDYLEQWPTLLQWVKYNLQTEPFYGPLYVLKILSKKYEFKSDEERTPVLHVVEETFPYLLIIFKQLVEIANPSLEVADLLKLICKIFCLGDLPFRSSDRKAFSQIFVKEFAGKILGCHLILLDVIRTGGYLPDNIVEYWHSPTTTAMNFVKELVTVRGKEKLQQFLSFIFRILDRYAKAPREYKSHCQKDGALLAIGALRDKLKLIEPYKSELEQVLVQHVFPEFSSQLGHLRSKVVIAGMHDPELPVRVESVLALHSFVKACKDLSDIRPVLQQLIDEFFEVMNEVGNEDLLAYTFGIIVEKFGEEVAPYAIESCQKLADAFWKCWNTAAILPANVCLKAINAVLESIRRLPHLFVHIEPILLPIMRRMLTADGKAVLKEVLRIVSYVTFASPNISLDMWTLWPLLMEALAKWAIDFFPNILVSLDNYISRSTSNFLTCKEPDYQQSLWNMIETVMCDVNRKDDDIKPAAELIQVLFRNCKGQVDHWVAPYLGLCVNHMHSKESDHLECIFMEVVADALYYNASLTLNILQKIDSPVDIFNRWFDMLHETKETGESAFTRECDMKICCLGLISLLSLPADQLPKVMCEQVFIDALDLLFSFEDKLTVTVEEEKDGSCNEGDSKKRKRLASQVSMASRTKNFRTAGDISHDDEVESPIDDVDPFIFFADTTKGLKASDPLRFENLLKALSVRYQAFAVGIFQYVDQKRLDTQQDNFAAAVF